MDGNATKSKKTKQNSFVWEWNLAQPAQVSGDGCGDGWAANKPINGLGRAPILGQKQLKAGSIKRALAVHSKGKRRRTKEGGRKTQEIKQEKNKRKKE